MTDTLIEPVPTAPKTLAAPVEPKSQPSIMAGEELPDTSMLWRRLISTLLCLIGDYIFWDISRRVPVAELPRLCLYVILYNALLSMFYFGGASAADIVKTIAAVKTKRNIMQNVTQQLTDSKTVTGTI